MELASVVVVYLGLGACLPFDTCFWIWVVVLFSLLVRWLLLVGRV
jgi:hypothetical protein